MGKWVIFWWASVMAVGTSFVVYLVATTLLTENTQAKVKGTLLAFY